MCQIQTLALLSALSIVTLTAGGTGVKVIGSGAVDSESTGQGISYAWLYFGGARGLDWASSP